MIAQGYRKVSDERISYDIELRFLISQLLLIHYPGLRFLREMFRTQNEVGVGGTIPRTGITQGIVQ